MSEYMNGWVDHESMGLFTGWFMDKMRVFMGGWVNLWVNRWGELRLRSRMASIVERVRPTTRVVLDLYRKGTKVMWTANAKKWRHQSRTTETKKLVTLLNTKIGSLDKKCFCKLNVMILRENINAATALICISIYCNFVRLISKQCCIKYITEYKICWLRSAT